MNASEVSQLFKVLANAIRVQIILMLAESPMSYSSIQARLGGIATGTLNFHLTKLKPLIQKVDDLYSLTPLGEKAMAFIDSYSEVERISTPKKNDMWESFLHLDPKYVLPLALLSYGTGLVMSFMGAPLYVVSAGLVVTNAVYARFAMEKIYQSETPSRLVFTATSSAVIGLLLFMSVVLGTISDAYFDLVAFTYGSGGSDLLRAVVDTVPHMDFSAIVGASFLGLLVGVVVARHTYGELPDLSPVSREHEVVVSEVVPLSRLWLSVPVVLLPVTYVAFELSFILVSSSTAQYPLIRILSKLTTQTLIAVVQGPVLWGMSRRIDPRTWTSRTRLYAVMVPSMALEYLLVGYWVNYTSLPDVRIGLFGYEFRTLIAGYDLPNYPVLILLRYFTIFVVLHSVSPSNADDRWQDTLELILSFVVVYALFQVPLAAQDLLPFLVVGYAVNFLIKLVPWRRFRPIFLIAYGLFALFVVFLQLVSPVEQGIATSLFMTIVTLMINLYKD